MLGASGCSDDFFDINENPNAPTEESITPQVILPRVLHATAARMATSYDYSAHWMGYWARSGSYGPSAEQESYNITTTYQADEWSGWYDILKDVDLMEEKATATGDKFYIAAAKYLKSVGFMYLVDQYNNVPYSQAFDYAGGNILPAYDKGEDIYKDLLLQLEEAAKLMAEAEVTSNTSTVDILVYSQKAGAAVNPTGAAEKLLWRKLINTQRLKLILRQVNVPGFNAKAETDKVVAEGSGFLMAGETVAVQPGYAEAAGQQNPFYDTYEESALGAVDNYNRANNYVLNKLRDNNDPRYQYYFSQAATPRGGILYYGYNFGEIIPNDAPNAANSSDVSGPGLAKSPTQPQWLFTSIESLFLQAEATQRGLLAGDAKTTYEAAVKESFNWLEVENAETAATTYLSEEFANFDDPGNTNKINLIVMQKYLSLVGINNFEAWVDYRRVGVPTDLPLSLYPGRGGNNIPVRLLYPQAEFTYNAANVSAQGNINAQTSKVFWDKN